MSIAVILLSYQILYISSGVCVADLDMLEYIVQ